VDSTGDVFLSHSEPKILNLLADWFDKELFAHSLRVRDVAKEMAKHFKVDVEKASLAGLLHDFGRGIREADMLSEAKKLNIPVNYVEKINPCLLHAPLGGKLVVSRLGIKDVDTINAISRHTVGEPQMSDLDMVVYIADMIEPARSFSDLEKIRDFGHKRLLEVFELAYVCTLYHLLKWKKFIHPKSFEVWNWIQSSKIEE